MPHRYPSEVLVVQWCGMVLIKITTPEELRAVLARMDIGTYVEFDYTKCPRHHLCHHLHHHHLRHHLCTPPCNMSSLYAHVTALSPDHLSSDQQAHSAQVSSQLLLRVVPVQPDWGHYRGRHQRRGVLAKQFDSKPCNSTLQQRSLRRLRGPCRQRRCIRV